MEPPPSPSPRQAPFPRSEPSGAWIRAAWQYGFALIFSVVAMLYGLHFGGVILQTQRDGITAITRIEQFQMEQVYQLRQISDRLDRIEAQLEAAGGG